MANIDTTWRVRIQEGVFTKSMCQQFTSAVARSAAGYPMQGRPTNLLPRQCESLVRILRKRGGVRLTDEHTAQGVSWLTKYGTKVLGLPEEVMANFSHFLYTGNIVTFNERRTFTVWRIVLTDGRMVDYYNAAWQGGGDDQGWRWVEDEPGFMGASPFRDVNGPIFA